MQMAAAVLNTVDVDTLADSPLHKGSIRLLILLLTRAPVFYGTRLSHKRDSPLVLRCRLEWPTVTAAHAMPKWTAHASRGFQREKAPRAPIRRGASTLSTAYKEAPTHPDCPPTVTAVLALHSRVDPGPVSPARDLENGHGLRRICVETSWSSIRYKESERKQAFL
jgi:hypothetical protein